MPAVSKNQQQLFGMVHAYQQGELKNPSGKVKAVAKNISKSGAKDFASTGHKGLPEKESKFSTPNRNRMKELITFPGIGAAVGGIAGGTGGALTAGKGKAPAGAVRGLVRGAGTGAGAGLGALGGGMAGDILAKFLASQGIDLGIDGSGLGSLAGAGLGGLSGYKLTRDLTEKESADRRRRQRQRTKFASWMIRYSVGKSGLEKVAAESNWVKLAQAIHRGEGVLPAIKRIYRLSQKEAAIKASSVIVFGIKEMLCEEQEAAKRAYANLGKKISRISGSEKKSVLTGASIGGLMGGLTGPTGKRLESTGRGIGRGVGTEIGAGLGTLAGTVGGAGLGGLAGGLGGAGLAGLLGLIQQGKIDPELLAALASSGALGGAGLGGLVGGAGGMIGGGMKGYNVAGNMMGSPSWEGAEENTVDQPTDSGKMAMSGSTNIGNSNTASSMSASMPMAPSMSTTVPAAQAGATMSKMSVTLPSIARLIRDMNTKTYS